MTIPTMVVIVRRSAMYLDNKDLGRVTWGLWSEAKDDITKDNVVIKGSRPDDARRFLHELELLLAAEGWPVCKC